MTGGQRHSGETDIQGKAFRELGVPYMGDVGVSPTGLLSRAKCQRNICEVIGGHAFPLCMVLCGFVVWLLRSSFYRVALQPWAFTPRSRVFPGGCIPSHWLYPTMCCDISNCFAQCDQLCPLAGQDGCFLLIIKTDSSTLLLQLWGFLVISVRIPFGVFPRELNW